MAGVFLGARPEKKKAPPLGEKLNIASVSKVPYSRHPLEPAWAPAQLAQTVAFLLSVVQQRGWTVPSGRVHGACGHARVSRN